jgi:hypothetical protein
MSEAPKQFNTKGGKNYKKNKSGRVREVRQRATIDVESGEGYYGTIVKMCGCDNVSVQARTDNEIYRVQIPGRMYNRGGSKNRLKVGDEVLVLGPLDKNIIGVIDRAVRSTDLDYNTATRNSKKSLFDDNDEDDVDDTYEALLRQGRSGSKLNSRKGGEKMYSTEEEIMAGVASIQIQNLIPDDAIEEESSDSNDVEDLPNLEEI